MNHDRISSHTVAKNIFILAKSFQSSIYHSKYDARKK